MVFEQIWIESKLKGTSERRSIYEETMIMEESEPAYIVAFEVKRNESVTFFRGSFIEGKVLVGLR